MGATTKYGIRYPELIDPADANFAMKRMAEDVETALGTVVVSELVGSAVISAQPGWTIANRTATVVGKSVIASFLCTRTGGNIPVNTSTGNIATSNIGTIVASITADMQIGFVVPLLLGGVTADGTYAVLQLTPAGTLQLVGVRPNLPTITNSSIVQFTASWSLGT